MIFRLMPKIAVVVGGILIALRLFFPVLECDAGYGTCDIKRLIFFSFTPVDHYHIHVQRTNSEAVAIGILIATAWLVSKRRKDV